MSLSITTTYSGEHALPFISAAVKSSRTIEAGGVNLMQNVKYKATIQNIAASTIIKGTDCDFEDNTSVTSVERVIEPKELMTSLALCKQEFHDDYLSKYQVMSANDNVPPNFQTYLLSYIGSKIGEALEDMVWTGDDGDDAFDGFLTILTDAAAGTDADDLPAGQDNTFTNTSTDLATGEFAILEPETVVDALRQVIADVPDTVYSKGPQNFMLYAGFGPTKALVHAYGTQAGGINDQANMWWNGGFNGLRIDGVDLFVAPGIAGTTHDGTVIATYRDNLVFGTGLFNDTNEASVLDMAKLDGSRNVRIIYRYTGGCQIGHIPDVVLYTKGTAKA